MIESNTPPENESENETFPIEPRYHPIHKIPRKIFDFLASAKLAMFLLVIILVCCVFGVTVFREKRAWEAVFSTLWFNGLLVLLVINVACCFFGRVWGRRVTLVSLGMILFHLSFVTMFAGIIYNSLFYFRGAIRLTEGETLSNGDPLSYDSIAKGRFFSFAKLKGETSLIKMHVGYKVDSMDKRVAYEVAVGNGPQKKQEIIYVTKHLDYRGFKYIPDKEGYSALTILYDSKGRELFGAHLPLQSIMNKDKSYLYTIGTKDSRSVVLFPQAPLEPLFNLNVSYKPDAKKERNGEVQFELYPLTTEAGGSLHASSAVGTAAIGSRFDAGTYSLLVKEIRYWTTMSVRYEPGQPIVLSSLWVGLFGVTLTTVARMFKSRKLL